MLYKSLGSSNEFVNFEVALKKGLADDGSLFFPKKIKKLDHRFIQNLENYSDLDIAYKVIKQFIGNTISEINLKKILNNTIDFDFPLIEIEKNLFTLELFNGPTLAFKDVGARFMANCLDHFSKINSRNNTVLVATSGDTGAAVGNGFLNSKFTKVVILYPKNKVSEFQELQLTSFGNNITALRINGNFDKCQDIVKKAFNDKDLKNKFNLTSANSINVARWLPQTIYYFFALKKLKKHNVAFSVPSGNFGNICAGIISMKLGLPISHFIASTNANDTVPRYMQSKIYKPLKTVETISNAMDVSDPSNFIRILEVFENFENLKKNFSSYSFDDIETLDAVKEIFYKENYVLDPHGAIGYLGIKKYMSLNKCSTGVFLETAHPIKFSELLEKKINTKLIQPVQGKNLSSKKKIFYELETYNDFKKFMLEKPI